MSVQKCKVCGAYNGIAQWPPEERSNYNPDKCPSCAQKEIEEAADADAETTPEDDSLEAQLDDDDSQDLDAEETDGE